MNTIQCLCAGRGTVDLCAPEGPLDYFSVKCNGCDATTPEFETHEQSIRVWNAMQAEAAKESPGE